MIRPILLAGALAAAVTLSGCAAAPAQPIGTHALPDPAADVEHAAWERLRAITVEARDELRLLAKAQTAHNARGLTPEQHAQRAFQATYVPEGFKKLVSFRHIGEASRAGEAIASMAGYQFETFGVKPAQEPVVSIEIAERPLIDALHELGMQTGESIRVEVFEPEQLMRFIYRN